MSKAKLTLFRGSLICADYSRKNKSFEHDFVSRIQYTYLPSRLVK
jgi:hypothetical protein